MSIKKFRGYHGTLSEYAKSILNNGFNLPKVSYKHDHWLGHGVYFFAYHFLADYWATTKLNSYNSNNQNSKMDKAVLVADIEVEENHICDLDNPEEALKYNQAVTLYSREIANGKVTIDFSNGLNKEDKYFDSNVKKRISCFYHDLYAEENDVHFMIYTFKKPNPKFSGSLNIKNNKGNNIYIEYSEKQYCVFNSDIIKSTELYKEDYSIC